MSEREEFLRAPTRDPSLPERLRAWREHRVLTRRELARGAGCPVATIRDIEAGARRPRVSTLRYPAHVLEILPWLLEHGPDRREAHAARFAHAGGTYFEAIDEYFSLGGTGSMVFEDAGDDPPDVDGLEVIRAWVAEVFEAAGIDPAGTTAECAAGLTGRRAELRAASARFNATIHDIADEAQRKPRNVSFEYARAKLGDPPVVC